VLQVDQKNLPNFVVTLWHTAAQGSSPIARTRLMFAQPVRHTHSYSLGLEQDGLTLIVGLLCFGVNLAWMPRLWYVLWRLLIRIEHILPLSPQKLSINTTRFITPP